ncbi:acyl carrier protein [Rathayibacter tritici]|uniref:Coronafacic acid synthetase n=1 Tax=Rathayibacter tritici TaxID=33888 RepID=A0A160KQ15_9MICO|nr:acyl carrier protein [Rathayibacter tritici]AND15264.1 coronafacic acid synthetase [Rathayibacter tritici]PPI41189.1 acyl carrier protein [Rathayibacter tritici]
MTNLTPNGTEVEAAIIVMLRDDLYVEEEFGVDDSLRDDLGLDSLGFVELRSACEKKFGIAITESDFDSTNFGTVRNLAMLVARNVRALSA